MVITLVLAGCSNPEDTDQARDDPTLSVESKEHAERPLDLTISDIPASSSDPVIDQRKPAQLPDMFGKEESEKKTTFKVDVLRDEANPNYVDSIQGGTVSVEVKVSQSKSASKPAGATEEDAP